MSTTVTLSTLAPISDAEWRKIAGHTGMDGRYPEHRDVIQRRPPWRLGSGHPCRNDGDG